jgi:hypothetical protein
VTGARDDVSRSDEQAIICGHLVGAVIVFGDNANFVEHGRPLEKKARRLRSLVKRVVDEEVDVEGAKELMKQIHPFTLQEPPMKKKSSSSKSKPMKGSKMPMPKSKKGKC